MQGGKPKQLDERKGRNASNQASAMSRFVRGGYTALAPAPGGR